MREDQLRDALKSQHLASLKMMEDLLEVYPDSLWYQGAHTNPSWQIVYHALFYYRLYLHQKLSDFNHWEGHRKGAQNMVLEPDYTDPEPYSKQEMLTFLAVCRAFTHTQLAELDLADPDSGFEWYQVPKIEHLIVNVRHFQHHVGQLQDRLRNAENLGIRWVRND